MDDFRRTTCESCGAAIIFAVTPRAKNMPVDAEPTADGNVQLVSHGPDVPPLARVLTVAQQFGKKGTLRRSHFASCPDAKSWRRPR
jgi:hypothetical protein